MDQLAAGPRCTASRATSGSRRRMPPTPLQRSGTRSSSSTSASRASRSSSRSCGLLSTKRPSRRSYPGSVDSTDQRMSSSGPTAALTSSTTAPCGTSASLTRKQSSWVLVTVRLSRSQARAWSGRSAALLRPKEATTSRGFEVRHFGGRPSAPRVLSVAVSGGRCNDGGHPTARCSVAGPQEPGAAPAPSRGSDSLGGPTHASAWGQTGRHEMETRAVADITKGYPEQLAVLAEKLGAFMRTQGIEASAVVVVGREDQARVRTVFPPELQWISVQGEEMAAAPLVAVHTVATQVIPAMLATGVRRIYILSYSGTMLRLASRSWGDDVSLQAIAFGSIGVDSRSRAEEGRSA